ncbi:MAG: ankyrin repeat domain-containing protein [Prochloron sp. SP5CPC1]|nr:ankyrin repeat domain-containing protein [Candidatus Paraprochloron terpiosi SP5CPC1]
MNAILRFEILDAIEENNVDRVLELINQGAELNNPIDTTPLIWAARCGNVEMIKLLVEQGADVNLQLDDDGDFDTALMLAKDLETTKTLVELGADVNIKNMYQETAYSMAKFVGYQDICDYLEPLMK